MREFVTAVDHANAEDVDGGDTFTIDGHEVRYYKPKDGQLAVLMAATGRHSKDSERVAGLLNFFSSVLDTDSAIYIEERLLDRDDDFGVVHVTEIMEELVAEWGGRPTQRSSASTQSPKTDGQKSTPTTQQLTS